MTSGADAPITVGIADDQALVRRGIRLLVDNEPDLVVVGEASDGAEAVRLAQAHRPHVMLMDVHMPDVDGLEATRRICGDPALGSVGVIVLTTFELDEYVDEALVGGASGFLLKDSEPELILQAIRTVAGGEALIDPAVTKAMISRFATAAGPDGGGPEAGSDVGEGGGDAADPTGLLEVLTDREVEVLRLVAAGLSNAEIAEALFISIATARTHVSRILAKLGARDRAQLVVVAFETGLVRPGGPT